MDLSIVVLAAGQGTRMKSSKPKVLHPVGGKPMLAHVLTTARELHPAQIAIVYGYAGDAIKQAFPESDLIWVEQVKQCGTGDAVAKALPVIPDDHRVLILYGDVPLITVHTLQRLLKATPSNTVGVLTVQTPHPTGLGRIVRDETGAVQRIVEEQDANDIERQIHEVNTGIFVLDAKQLKAWLPRLKTNNKQGELYLTDIVQLAVSDNIPILTVPPSVLHEVLGVNDKIQQVSAERHYQRCLAEDLLRQGVWICDPNRFDLRGTLAVGRDVMIDVNVVFEGNVRLGDHTQVGPNTVLINCDIGEEVRILANSHLEGVKVGKGCTIGPFARLRPGTQLAEKVKVGNFVEIKNSTIGRESKVNHLSYIGDTTMGQKVNVGAGTITCNYDGVNKHRTTIEEGAHIGANSQLIAPVMVGKGAVLGAGTTLNKDAPPYQLTVTHRLCHRSFALLSTKMDLKE